MRWAMGVVLVASLACSGGAELPYPDANPPPSGPQSAHAACPDGDEVVELWAGEYPDPVVWIDAPTDLPVRAVPCAEPWRTCPVASGLYHPWARDKPEGTAFATINTVARFEAVDAFELTDGVDTIAVDPGTTVEVPTYLGEGHCAYRIPQGSGEPTEISGLCPEMLGEKLKAIGEGAVKTPERGPQFVRVPCADSPDPERPVLGWVLVDEALFEHETVRRGQITGYGEVAPPE
jgi:hypothetical protein